MGRSHEQPCDEILLARLHGGAPLAAATLRPIGRERHALDVAGVADRDDHVLALDQILVVEVRVAVENFGTARGSVSGSDRRQFSPDDVLDASTRPENIEQFGDLDRQFVQLLGDLVATKRGEARQSQLEDGAGLGFREPVVAVLVQHVARIRDQGDQRGHVSRRPGTLHQRLTSGAGVGRRPDQTDDFIDIGDRNGESDLNVGSIARLGQAELGPARNDRLTKIDEGDEDVAKRQHLGPTAVQRDHVGAETRLQLGEPPELVQDDIGHRIALQLDDDPHPVAIRFVAQF